MENMHTVNWSKRVARAEVRKICEAVVLSRCRDAFCVCINVDGKCGRAWILKDEFRKISPDGNKDTIVFEETEGMLVRLRWIDSANGAKNEKIQADFLIDGRKIQLYLLPDDVSEIINS